MLINLIKKSKMWAKSGAGFTLIELIVVVAIIAVLSSIVVTQFSSAQMKSRDARRIEDVVQIKKALSLYQVDNTQFPVETVVVIITGVDSFSTTLIGSGAMSAVPTDPRHPVTSYTYQSNSAGSDYDLTFCLEGNTIPNYTQGCGNTISP